MIILCSNCNKCTFPNGIVIKPDGVNELDPCVYREVERYVNATVVISECEKCGHIDIAWFAQPNTEKIDEEFA